MSEPSSLFLSHNWNDKVFARKLAADLERSGIRCWIDEAEIQLGDSLIEKIRAGIDEVDYVGVILSPDSVNSRWVQREVDIAMNQEIQGHRVKVLPLLYRKCELPGFLEGKLYADFTSETNYQSALALLARRLSSARRKEKRTRHAVYVGNLTDFFDDVDESRPLDTVIAADKEGKVVLYYNRPLRVHVKRIEYFLAERDLVFLSERNDRRGVGLPLSDEVAVLIRESASIVLVRLLDERVVSEMEVPFKVIE